MVDKVVAFWHSPLGPKTSQFWGPMGNWGLVVAAILDSNKAPEKISGSMTLVLIGYSCLFMRFALRVQPKNYLMFACHVSNVTAQTYLYSRKLRAEKRIRE
jgi:mitochondrial pyruvate carrier 1